jgi:hypothetical protein
MRHRVVAVIALILTAGACSSSRRAGVVPTNPAGRNGACKVNLRLFNPEILGRSVDEPAVLLGASEPHSVDPVSVLTGLKDGRYSSATVFYPERVSLETVRDCIDSIYAKHRYKDFSTIWRIEEEKFSISIDRDEAGVRVMYFAFQSTTTVFRDMIEAGVFGTDVRRALSGTGENLPDAERTVP